MNCRLTIEVEQRRFVRGQPPTWELIRKYSAQGKLTPKRIFVNGILPRNFNRETGMEIRGYSDKYRHRVIAINGKPLNEN